MTDEAALQVEKAAIRLNEGQIFSIERPGRHHDVIALVRQSGYTGPVGATGKAFC